MSLATEIADAIQEIQLPQTCEGCLFLGEKGCKIWSGDCINNPFRPYWQPKVNPIPIIVEL